MLTVEIRVNGVLVGQVHAQNTGDRRACGNSFAGGPPLEYRYVWWYTRVVSIDGHSPPDPVLDGECWHQREDGIEALVSTILELASVAA